MHLPDKRPFSPACARNRDPILDILREVFADASQVLEIGAGTGQHAVYFSAHLPHLSWQPSDRAENLDGICEWVGPVLQENPDANLHIPFELDVTNREHWPPPEFDGIFSANTAHIMPVEAVEAMFDCVGRILLPGGVFCLYGPFRYGGDYTSQSNADFDVWLKDRDPAQGIREIEWLQALGEEKYLFLEADHAMPANNQLLVWRKIPS